MDKTYVPRRIEKRLRHSATQFPVLVLTGPRQSGKSTLLQKLFPGHEYCTLDDPFKRNQANSDPLSFLENLEKKTIIDEIQYVPGLLPYIKMAVDRDRGRNGHFLLTGSQIFPLMSGISESLAGRVALHELLGFSYEELSGTRKLLLRRSFFLIFSAGDSIRNRPCTVLTPRIFFDRTCRLTWNVISAKSVPFRICICFRIFSNCLPLGSAEF